MCHCQCNDQAVLQHFVYGNKSVAAQVLPYNNSVMMSVHWRSFDILWNTERHAITTTWGTMPLLVHQVASRAQTPAACLSCGSEGVGLPGPTGSPRLLLHPQTIT